MATFQCLTSLEVREPVSSDCIERMRKLADDQKLDAFSLRYRHPRFKNCYTVPHYYVRFKVSGVSYTEDASSLERMDACLEETYISASPTRK